MLIMSSCKISCNFMMDCRLSPTIRLDQVNRYDIVSIHAPVNRVQLNWRQLYLATSAKLFVVKYCRNQRCMLLNLEISIFHRGKGVVQVCTATVFLLSRGVQGEPEVFDFSLTVKYLVYTCIRGHNHLNQVGLANSMGLWCHNIYF